MKFHVRSCAPGSTREGAVSAGAIDKNHALSRTRGGGCENSNRTRRARGRGPCRRRALLAQKPLGLSPRGSPLPRAPPAHPHDRAPARDPGPRTGRAPLGSRSGNRLLHGRGGPGARSQRGSRSLRQATQDARRDHAPGSPSRANQRLTDVWGRSNVAVRGRSLRRRLPRHGAWGDTHAGSSPGRAAPSRAT